MTEFTTGRLTEPIQRRHTDRHAPDLGTEPPEWISHAACATVTDPDGVFFAPRGVNPAAARRICRGCAVTAACLADALAVEANQPYLFGVFGGLTPRERAVILRANGQTCPHCGRQFRNLQPHLNRSHCGTAAA